MSDVAEPEAVPGIEETDYPFVRLVDYVAKLLADGKPEIYRHIIHEVDRHMLREVMKHFRNNQLQAAERLGISRMTLRSKLRALGMIPMRNHNHDDGGSPDNDGHAS